MKSFVSWMSLSISWPKLQLAISYIDMNESNVLKPELKIQKLHFLELLFQAVDIVDTTTDKCRFQKKTGTDLKH